MKKLLSLLLAVVLAACSLSMAFAEPIADAPTKESWGDDLSGFSTVDLNGDPIDGSIFKNADITFLNMWATWCGPCKAEMPDIQAMYEYLQEHSDMNVQIIGVITNDSQCTPPDAKAYLDANNFTYPNIVPDNILRNAFRSGYVPETLIVDSNGIVRDDWVGGFTSMSQIQSFLNQWLEIVSHEGEQCTITYVNGATQETISTATVGYGYPIPDPPAAPEVEGHKFKQWKVTAGDYMDSGYETTTFIVLGDLTVTAEYEAQKFKVKFYDGVTGNLLNVQQVEYKQAATPPQHPEHEGYTFNGWDTDFSSVTEDLNVHGVCTPVGEQPPVTDEPTPTPPVTEPPTTPPVTDEPTPTPPVTEPPVTDEPGQPGDMNGDGETKVDDALDIARLAMGLGEGDSAVADVNGDGKVDMSDALIIVRIAMGI